MNARYSRLISGEEDVSFNYLKWAQTNLPTVFLRQQLMLVGLTVASLMLLLFTTFFTSDIDYELPQTAFASRDLNYGVIVDCGSSGTRAHIFQWRQEDSKLHSIELLRDPLSHKPLNRHITPGLSSLQADPDKASDYMEPIMNFISESIPVERHLETPIYFMATAGLRLLDKSIQRKLLSDITRDLRVKFNFPKIRSQVISGEHEGVYSWLSLNRMKIFNQEESADKNETTKSFGMIEMGGASTQVAFELSPEVESAIIEDLKSSEAIEAFKHEHITLNLGQNKSIKLFASTFLGLGVNSARESAIDLLVRDYLGGTSELGSKHEKNFEVRLQDPCLTVGSSEIVLRPSELITSTHQSIGFVVRQQEDTFKVRLEGSGNFLNCLTLLERVLKIVQKERLNCDAATNNLQQAKQSCPIVLLGSNFIPFKYQPFVGLSEMFFTTNEMVNAAGRFNRTKVLHETNRICGTEYNKLLEMYSNNGVSFEDRILYECFKSSWLLTIIHNSGFRMPTTYDNFVTAEKLDGHEIDWTIGAMLSEVALNKIRIGL